MPKGHGNRADRLLRTDESVVRNTVVRVGRCSHADSSKLDQVARGQTMECAACLAFLRLRNLVPAPRYEEGIVLLESVAATLAKMT